MSKQKLKLDRILELSNAVDAVGNNDRLSGKTSYWLGRLGDNCSGPIRSLRAAQNKALMKIKPDQNKLFNELQGLHPQKDSLEIARINRDIQEYNIQYADEIKDLGEQEEEIEIPEFKLVEFIAAQDTVYAETLKDIDTNGKEITRKIEITVKKGNSLVPIKFFKLMGEYVTE